MIDIFRLISNPLIIFFFPVTDIHYIYFLQVIARFFLKIVSEICTIFGEVIDKIGNDFAEDR